VQAASEGIKVAFEVQKGVHHSAPKSTQNPRGTIGGILFFTLGKCRFHAGCNGIFESLSSSKVSSNLQAFNRGRQAVDLIDFFSVSS